MFFRFPAGKLRALLNAINPAFSEISQTQQNVLYVTSSNRNLLDLVERWLVAPAIV